MKKFAAVVFIPNSGQAYGTAYFGDTADQAKNAAASQADNLRKQGHNASLGLFVLSEVGTIPPAVLVDWKAAT